MRILHKYIGFQIIGTAFLAVGLFVFVLVMGSAFKDILQQLASHKLSIGTFAQLLFLVIPKVIPYAFPMGFLMAVLIVLGRLSSQYEFTAMRASGIATPSITAPIFFLSFVAGLMCLLIDMYYAPLASTAYRRTLYSIAHKNPSRFFKPNTFIKEFPGYVMYIEESKGVKLKGVWMWELDASRQPINFLKANEGVFEHDREREGLILNLMQGSAEKRSPNQAPSTQHFPTIAFDKISIRLSLDKIFKTQTTTRKLSYHTLPELLRDRHHWRSSINTSTEAVFKDRIKVQLEIQKKVSMAFSIFSLTLMGIPLAIRNARQETTFNFLLTIAIGFTYYIATTAFAGLEKFPHWRPDLCIWLPNIVCQIIGVILFKRLLRK